MSTKCCPRNTCSCSAQFVSSQWVTLPPGPCVTRFIWHHMGLLRWLVPESKPKLKQVPSREKSNTRSLASNPQSYWKGWVPCLCLHRHPISERWRPVSKKSQWGLLSCGWSRKKMKSEWERTSVLILCLQYPSTEGHGLQKAKMNEISFFFYFSISMRPH